MESLAPTASADLHALAIWDLLWREVEHLIADIGATLGAHLRERPIAAWRDPEPRSLAGGWLVVGRARLRLVLDVDDGARPAVFFGSDRVLRLTAFAERPAHVRRGLATLWIDSTRLRWTSTETEGEIFRLDDRFALERFFLALLVDAG